MQEKAVFKSSSGEREINTLCCAKKRRLESIGVAQKETLPANGFKLNCYLFILGGGVKVVELEEWTILCKIMRFGDTQRADMERRTTASEILNSSNIHRCSSTFCHSGGWGGFSNIQKHAVSLAAMFSSSAEIQTLLLAEKVIFIPLP